MPRLNHHKHWRPPRPNTLRKDFDLQTEDNFLLQLPAEIRNQIYGYALTKPDRTIELWPYAKIDAAKASVDSSDPKLQAAALKLLNQNIEAADIFEAVYLYFRDQKDLLYVRQQLGVALLSTCRQIYHEAFPFLYRDNTFRFSDDVNYFGLRRFLTTIGPRARREMQCLQLAYPDAYVSVSSDFVHQCAEHYPALTGFAELHMDRYLSQWRGTIENNPEVAECNAAFVSQFLRGDMRKTLREIRFVVTRGNWFNAEVETKWRDPDSQMPADMPVLLEKIEQSFRDTPWIRKTIVVEAGADFSNNQLSQGMAFKICGLLMQAGSRNSLIESVIDTEQQPPPDGWCAEVRTETVNNNTVAFWQWTKDQSFPPSSSYYEEDISYGIQELLELYEESVPACGGKAAAGPSVGKPRYLKAFAPVHATGG